jgi:hypothetical protein
MEMKGSDKAITCVLNSGRKKFYITKLRSFYYKIIQRTHKHVTLLWLKVDYSKAPGPML